jgi:two-component system response regulator ChvI
MRMQKITLIDDDENILTSVSMALEAEDFDVTAHADSQQGLAHVLKKTPDLVVLDVKMPRLDGLGVLEGIRKESSVPVIFLTSKDDEVDEVLGLRLGADDYITKPFSQRLLIERIRTILRREAARANTAPETQEEKSADSQRNTLFIDKARHLCEWKGVAVSLTVTEFMLIEALISRPGQVLSRDQLIDSAYGANIYVDDRTIDAHIRRVRKKFKIADSEFDQIETLYGIGYRFKDIKPHA